MDFEQKGGEARVVGSRPKYLLDLERVDWDRGALLAPTSRTHAERPHVDMLERNLFAALLGLNPKQPCTRRVVRARSSQQRHRVAFASATRWQEA